MVAPKNENDNDPYPFSKDHNVVPMVTNTGDSDGDEPPSPTSSAQQVYAKFKDTNTYQIRRNADAVQEYLDKEPEAGTLAHQRWRLACMIELPSAR